jgi:hypothetical protein
MEILSLLVVVMLVLSIGLGAEAVAACDTLNEPLSDAAPSLTEKLAETGGVLMPPEHGRLIVIDPPDTGPNSMRTTPEIMPRGRSGEASTPSLGKDELERDYLPSM